MFCDDKSAYSDEHNERRLKDTALIGGQNRFATGIFVLAAFGYEYRVVVALSENESGENDVDYIEFYAENRHYSENPNPTEGHREERNQCEGKTAE